MESVVETTATDLGALLDAGAGTVVTLVAGDTSLAAHRAVLAARSPVFAAMFQHDTLEASSGQVSIADVEGPVLRQLLAYMYTLQAPHLSDMAHQLLAAADKYGLSVLKTRCEQQVAAQLDVETAAATAVLAIRHSCSSLRKDAVTFIKAHTHQVMATQGWADAMRNQPEDLIEVSRLLCDPPTDTRPAPTSQPYSNNSHRGQAPTAAEPSTVPRRTARPGGEAGSRFRSLSGEEKGQKLIEAAEEGAVEELRALLAAGADVGAMGGEQGRTALHLAAEEGHVEAARCLVQSGADVDAVDSDLNTPLHLAVYSGHLAVVELLLESFADPNARDGKQRTPLHDAVWRGHADVVAVLLEAGAEREATDLWGQTPMDKARRKNNHHLIDMLS